MRVLLPQGVQVHTGFAQLRCECRDFGTDAFHFGQRRHHCRKVRHFGVGLQGAVPRQVAPKGCDLRAGAFDLKAHGVLPRFQLRQMQNLFPNGCVNLRVRHTQKHIAPEDQDKDMDKPTVTEVVNGKLILAEDAAELVFQFALQVAPDTHIRQHAWKIAEARLRAVQAFQEAEA